LRAFREKFERFEQFFAVKALPNPAICKLLVDEGCGLDCSSTSELWLAQKLGVPGNKVMYTSNYTSADDLKFAAEYGVVINLDDATLVDTLASVAKPFPETICFRVNPGLGRTDSSTKSNVLGGPEAKFGVPLEQVIDAYRAAKTCGATRFGIHMMTGSCVLKDEYWSETVARLFQVMSEARTALGIEFDFVNIGGGLGIPYKPEEAGKTVDLEGLSKRIRSTVDTALASAGAAQSKVPALYMENGRFITGPYGWLVTRCRATKVAFGQRYCGVDACMAHLMRPGMYGSYHHITVPGREGRTTVAGLPAGPGREGAGAAHGGSAAASEGGREESKTSEGKEDDSGAADRAELNVVGTLCENNDWFAKARNLPATSTSGDLFVIHDTGAHSHSMGFQYNGKLRAPELLIRSGGSASAPRVDMIRSREVVEVLFADTSIPSDMGSQPDFGLPVQRAGEGLGFGIGIGSGGGGKGLSLLGKKDSSGSVGGMAAGGSVFSGWGVPMAVLMALGMGAVAGVALSNPSSKRVNAGAAISGRASGRDASAAATLSRFGKGM